MKKNSISEQMREKMEVDMDIENCDPWIPMCVQSPDSNVQMYHDSNVQMTR